MSRPDHPSALSGLRFNMLTVALCACALSTYGTAFGQTTDPDAMAALLPPAPSGWTSTDGQAFRQQAAGTEVGSVSRTYTNADGARVDLTIIGSPAMVAAANGASAMFRNSSMLDQMNAADPQKRFALIDREGWTGWSVVDGSSGESEATAFNEQLVVQIETNRGDAEMLRQFVEAVPWNDLANLHD